MAKRQIDSSLYCTPERVRHSREMIIEPRETESAGNVVMTGQRELQTCALDVMHRNGLLVRPADRKDEARWRFNAGCWLRDLYLKTHPTDGVGAYRVRLEGEKDFIMRPTPETPVLLGDNDWNFQCFMDTTRDLKAHWRILEQVCCEDVAPTAVEPVRAALDALLALREGYIPDFLASFEKALEND
jgi:hypothetical protein